jgi:hypothetical protein
MAGKLVLCLAKIFRIREIEFIVFFFAGRVHCSLFASLRAEQKVEPTCELHPVPDGGAENTRPRMVFVHTSCSGRRPARRDRGSLHDSRTPGGGRGE